ncbi:MAG: hypothetical protein KKF00_12580 [Proteobacteria bacterium]|nr:hypothetical protein [Pseudomonadota bacterium]
MAKLKLTTYYICIIALLFSFTAYSEETKGNRRFQYAELVVVHRFYGEADGIAQMSTTVYLNDGSEKEISSYRKESIISFKDAKNEAFKDLIERYKNIKITASKVSEIYVLNMLGMEGWEIISYDDKPLNFAEGSGSKLRYLMKREISIK